VTHEPAQTAQLVAVAAAAPVADAVAAPPAVELPESVLRDRQMTKNIRAFLDGALEVSVLPESLFDARLNDEQAILLAAKRIHLLLHEVDRDQQLDTYSAPTTQQSELLQSWGAMVNSDGYGAPLEHDAYGEQMVMASTPVPNEQTAVDSYAETMPVAASVGDLYSDVYSAVNDAETVQAAPPPALITHASREEKTAWEARLELDRARVAFYDLSPEARQKLIEQQNKRISEASEADQQKLEAERMAREAEDERKRALEAAQRARSEAEKVVAEEMARLLGFGQQLASLDGQFNELNKQLEQNHDLMIGWQQRVKEAEQGTANAADITYDALRSSLRNVRKELDGTISALLSAHSVVPPPLELVSLSVPSDMDISAIANKTDELNQKIVVLQQTEHALKVKQAAVLIDSMDQLNHERLSLLDHLSPAKRQAIFGFSAVSFDQAMSELRHFYLIMSYHRYIVTEWIQGLGQSNRAFESTAGTSMMIFIPWLLAILLFSWVRRRTPVALHQLLVQIEREDRRQRLVAPSPALKGVRFTAAIHRPVEWAILLFLLWETLPDGAQNLFEVQIITLVAGWALAAALVVDLINGAFVVHDRSDNEADYRQGLRIRSLRLVGRVAVTFGLILILSSRLVGEGTIYNWISSFFWLAAIPVFLILVSWWRDTVFTRIERIRKKSPFHQWVLANPTGWKSFFAAMAAAVHVFFNGSMRIIKTQLNRAEIAKRAHAWLFRRELDKIDGGRRLQRMTHLERSVLHKMINDETCRVSFPEDHEAWFAGLVHRIRQRKGGVVAIIGEQGSGKSWTLSRLGQAASGTLSLCCDEYDSLAHLKSNLAEKLELDPHTELDVIGKTIDKKESSTPMLLDDGEVFIKPLMGGVAHFDDMIELARTYSSYATWVIAIDRISWQYLQRARDVQTMFDEVIQLECWTEEEISTLLDGRLQKAGIIPSFDLLLEAPTSDDDEIDIQEREALKKSAYFRLIWDYSKGNPMVAIYLWWASLVVDTGDKIFVRPFQVPELARLEQLPDTVMFVFRAILQLNPAIVDDIVHATHLPSGQTNGILRYGLNHEYIVVVNDKYSISWKWYRAITTQLQRRHLIT